VEIFVSGSLAYDRIMTFPGKFEDHILPEKIHVLNVCFTVNGLQEKFGGTAGNIAYGLALLGEQPRILAAAGKDFGQYEAWLVKHKLSLDAIRRVPDEFTAGAYITTDLSDNQITGFNPGAMQYPSQFVFDGVDPKGAMFIIAPGNLEDMLSYSRTCKKKTIPHIFDPGQSIPALSGEQLEEMLSGCTLLISNDYELELIMRATGLDKDTILSRTEGIITTLGEKGSLLCLKDGETRIPAVGVEKVLDPTGAGDAYRAGLLKGLALGKSLPVSAKMGTVSAAYSVERYGTQEYRFSGQAFWDRYEAAFGAIP